MGTLDGGISKASRHPQTLNRSPRMLDMKTLNEWKDSDLN